MEASVHGQLALLFWGLLQRAHHGREHMVGQRCSPHDQEEKKRKRKRLGSHNPLQWHAPSYLKPPSRPHLVTGA
jgi:hypothetical protein